MYLYISLICIYLVLAIIDEKVEIKIVHNNKINKILRLIILLSPLFITVAFRDFSVGNDTMMYKYLYENYANLPYKLAIKSTGKEWGFVSICYVMSKMGLDYFHFQIIIALITYFSLGRFLYKHSQNFSCSILVFMCTLGYFRSMNISREIMAAMIALNFIDCYIEGKKIKFTIGILISSLIHRSALIMLLLLAYDYIKKLKPLKKMFAILGIIIAFFSVDRLLPIITKLTGRYEYLIDSKYTNSNGILAMIALIIFALFFYYIEVQHKNNKIMSNLIEKQKEDSNERRSNIILYSYYICIVFGVIGLRFGLADRAVIYYSTLFTESCSYREKGISKIVKYILIVSLIIYYILVMIYRNNWQGTIPFHLLNLNTMPV